MKKHIILLWISCCIIFLSCGTFVNKTYIHQSSDIQNKYTPLEITTIEDNFIYDQDSLLSFYRIDANIIKHIATTVDKYILFVSFYNFCEYSKIYFDSVNIFAQTHNIPLLVIDNTDWLYQNDSRLFFQNKAYQHHIYALDIHKYGSQFHCRKRWQNFILELCNQRTESWGYNDVILLDNQGNILVCGDFTEVKNILINKLQD